MGDPASAVSPAVPLWPPQRTEAIRVGTEPGLRRERAAPAELSQPPSAGPPVRASRLPQKASATNRVPKTSGRPMAFGSSPLDPRSATGTTTSRAAGSGTVRADQPDHGQQQPQPPQHGRHCRQRHAVLELLEQRRVDGRLDFGLSHEAEGLPVPVDDQGDRDEADGAERTSRLEQTATAEPGHARQEEKERHAEQRPPQRFDQVDERPRQGGVAADGFDGGLDPARVVGTIPVASSPDAATVATASGIEPPPGALRPAAAADLESSGVTRLVMADSFRSLPRSGGPRRMASAGAVRDRARPPAASEEGQSEQTGGGGGPLAAAVVTTKLRHKRRPALLLGAPGLLPRVVLPEQHVGLHIAHVVPPIVGRVAGAAGVAGARAAGGGHSSARRQAVVLPSRILPGERAPHHGHDPDTARTLTVCRTGSTVPAVGRPSAGHLSGGGVRDQVLELWACRRRRAGCHARPGRQRCALRGYLRPQGCRIQLPAAVHSLSST